jgi:hypothetical protein
MFLYEGSELIGFLLKTIAILFFSGTIAIPFVPARIKPIKSISLVFVIAFFPGNFVRTLGTILILFIGIVLNL